MQTKTAPSAALICCQRIHSFGILRHDLLLSFHREVFTSDKFTDVFAEFRSWFVRKISCAEKDIVTEKLDDSGNAEFLEFAMDKYAAALQMFRGSDLKLWNLRATVLVF